MLSCSGLTVTPPVYKLLRSRHIFASVAYQILPSHEIGVAAIRINKKSSLLLLSCFILGYYKCGRSFSRKNASAGTLQLNNQMSSPLPQRASHPYHEGRKPPPRRTPAPTTMAPLVVGGGVPLEGGRWPLWWGVRRPSWWGY